MEGILYDADVSDMFARESQSIIDQTIERAQKNIYMLEDYENGEEGEGVVNVDAAPNTKWLTIEEFTIANGIKKIEDFIKVSYHTFQDRITDTSKLLSIQND